MPENNMAITSDEIDRTLDRIHEMLNEIINTPDDSQTDIRMSMDNDTFNVEGTGSLAGAIECIGMLIIRMADTFNEDIEVIGSVATEFALVVSEEEKHLSDKENSSDTETIRSSDPLPDNVDPLLWED